MKRKYKIGLLILSSAMLLTACNGEKTERKNDTVRNNESTIEKENELPEYAFAIKGYVEIQEGEIESINVEDYLPNEAMTLTYEDRTADQNLQYYYNIYPEEGKVRYEGESVFDVVVNSGGDSRYTSTGCYYYDTKADCLAEISSLPGMKEQDVAYLIPMGKSLKLNEISSIQNVSYLFTVSCEAGVYEDCIAVNKTIMLNDAETATVTYYTKGLGAVLTVTNYPNGGMDFRVTDILTKVEPIVATGYIHDETNENYSDRFYDDNSYQTQIENSPGEMSEYLDFPLEANTSYECFETETGDDVIITIDIQNDTPYIIFPGANYVELEVDGKGDAWEFINPYFPDERVYTAVSIQDNEITLSTNEVFIYDGTYIQLPDEGTDGE